MTLEGLLHFEGVLLFWYDWILITFPQNLEKVVIKFDFVVINVNYVVIMGQNVVIVYKTNKKMSRKLVFWTPLF
ncbi:hypothetical protein DYI25_11945 [Mesobacillus boroniphilus]|uniref:Uncharacterized protein n=1 Tax=Mesobacillus boroniphilus TaxID=308892 RepID=A0A944CMH0_9BACI|nr:hypothetical protein [Mesobacillus boroniphilus]